MVKIKSVSFYNDKSASEKQNSNLTFQKEPDGMIEVELKEVVSDGDRCIVDNNKIKLTRTYRWSYSKLLFLIGCIFIIIVCILTTLCMTNDFVINWQDSTEIDFNVTTNKSDIVDNTTRDKNDSDEVVNIVYYSEINYKSKREAPPLYTGNEENSIDSTILIKNKEEINMNKNTINEYYESAENEFPVPHANWWTRSNKSLGNLQGLRLSGGKKTHIIESNPLLKASFENDGIKEYNMTKNTNYTLEPETSNFFLPLPKAVKDEKIKKHDLAQNENIDKLSPLESTQSASTSIKSTTFDYDEKIRKPSSNVQSAFDLVENENSSTSSLFKTNTQADSTTTDTFALTEGTTLTEIKGTTSDWPLATSEFDHKNKATEGSRLNEDTINLETRHGDSTSAFPGTEKTTFLNYEEIAKYVSASIGDKDNSSPFHSLEANTEPIKENSVEYGVMTLDGVTSSIELEKTTTSTSLSTKESELENKHVEEYELDEDKSHVESNQATTENIMSTDYEKTQRSFSTNSKYALDITKNEDSSTLSSLSSKKVNVTEYRAPMLTTIAAINNKQEQTMDMSTPIETTSLSEKQETTPTPKMVHEDKSMKEDKFIEEENIKILPSPSVEIEESIKGSHTFVPTHSEKPSFKAREGTNSNKNENNDVIDQPPSTTIYTFPINDMITESSPPSEFTEKSSDKSAVTTTRSSKLNEISFSVDDSINEVDSIDLDYNKSDDLDDKLSAENSTISSHISVDFTTTVTSVTKSQYQATSIINSIEDNKGISSEEPEPIETTTDFQTTKEYLTTHPPNNFPGSPGNILSPTSTSHESSQAATTPNSLKYSKPIQDLIESYLFGLPDLFGIGLSSFADNHESDESQELDALLSSKDYNNLQSPKKENNKNESLFRFGNLDSLNSQESSGSGNLESSHEYSASKPRIDHLDSNNLNKFASIEKSGMFLKSSNKDTNNTNVSGLDSSSPETTFELSSLDGFVKYDQSGKAIAGNSKDSNHEDFASNAEISDLESSTLDKSASIKRSDVFVTSNYEDSASKTGISDLDSSNLEKHTSTEKHGILFESNRENSASKPEISDLYSSHLKIFTTTEKSGLFLELSHKDSAKNTSLSDLDSDNLDKSSSIEKSGMSPKSSYEDFARKSGISNLDSSSLEKFTSSEESGMFPEPSHDDSASNTGISDLGSSSPNKSASTEKSGLLLESSNGVSASNTGISDLDSSNLDKSTSTERSGMFLESSPQYSTSRPGISNLDSSNLDKFTSVEKSEIFFESGHGDAASHIVISDLNSDNHDIFASTEISEMSVQSNHENSASNAGVSDQDSSNLYNLTTTEESRIFLEPNHKDYASNTKISDLDSSNLDKFTNTEKSEMFLKSSHKDTNNTEISDLDSSSSETTFELSSLDGFKYDHFGKATADDSKNEVNNKINSTSPLRIPLLDQDYNTFGNTKDSNTSSSKNQTNSRWSGQDSANFENENIKTLAKELSAVSQHQERSQQSSISSNYGSTLCPTYVSPMGYPVAQQANASPYVYSSNQALPYTNMIPLPIPVPRFQTQSTFLASQFPYGGTNVSPNGYVLYGMNNPNIITPSSTTGQYYICNPLGTNIVGSVHKSDDDSEKDSSSEFTEDSDFQSSYAAEMIENKTRASRDCPFNERKCEDDSKCIKLHQFCDGDVHCKDASDEVSCPCRFRIGKSRHCDGYSDCPNGEDELKCFGCDVGMFSCDDWSKRIREATCIPMEQRCDGISQCPTGKDERGCSILTERFSERQHFAVSSTVGFLYRNFKGRWYPVCRNPELWANEICRSEAGPSTISPLVHLIPIKANYHGPYVSASSKEIAKITQSCESEAAVFVECPPLVCGMRKKMRNPYRATEVDTSAEQILSQFHKSEDVIIDEQNTTDSIVGDGRVVGGKPSQPEAWPWVVSMYRNGVFHCGGALINELWIVTAAHCVDKFWHYHYEIQAGVLRRYSYAPMVQRRAVSHVIGHQLYDRTKLKNDLALIRISEPFIFNQYVRPICLPSELTAGKSFMWGPEQGTLCTAVGWGATVEHGADPDHLREVEVPVLKHCKHREDQEGHEICAGFMEGGKDACQGDSGGPFMCRNPNVPNQWYLVGIVSHGEGCARPNEPGVYTRVSLFLEWIFENMKAEVLPQRRPLLKCPGYVCRKTKQCIANKRRCDRVVDCLLGDDEANCEKNAFNDIFKHAMAMRHMFFGFDPMRSPDNETVEATIIEANDNDKQVTKVSTEKTTLNLNVTKYKNQTKRFVCKRMLQVVDFSKRCDGNIDCEDATDEENCLCAVHLTSRHPEAICDGISDCLDSSDEDNCGTCKEDEYYCRLSKKCIPNSNRCNNVPECKFEEDELDCFILTNGKTVELDYDSRPRLNNSGFVSFLYGNSWRIVCSNWTDNVATLAADVCSYLGFNNYKGFHKIPLDNNGLQIVQNKKIIDGANTSFSGDKCMALFLKCSNAIDIGDQSDIKGDMVPWNAEIYINGEFKCTGTILDTTWIITSQDCFGLDFRLYENYVAVLLGRRKVDLNMVNPHEQIIQVVESVRVFDTDIVLLRLKEIITFTRYIRAVQFEIRDYAMSEKEICIATGRNSKNQTASVVLRSTSNCTAGYRCFKRMHPIDSLCQEGLSNSWSGTIVCQSKEGWYPAAVFHDFKGFCGFNSITDYASVQYWRTAVIKLMKQAPFVVSTPFCSGFRCRLGQCIERDKVCDRIPNCRDGADENLNYCREFKEDCSVLSNCDCLKSELKCRNGKCIPKESFCDRVNDCGDWSDEPDYCTCGAYLNLTNPEKVCDGIRNCYDRTDEDPQLCQCKAYHFRCTKTDHCVAPDMICDGNPDCPGGEDEAQCLALVSSPAISATEVQVRSGGLWHPGCFPKSLTTLQLEHTCAQLGFTGGSAVRVYPKNELAKKNTWLPVTDPFIGVVIHQNKTNNLVLAIRSGSKPFVTLQRDPNCYRLYLHCL